MPKYSLDWLDTFKFERIDRTSFVLDWTTPGEPEALTEQLCLAIVEEYQVRKALPKHHPKFIGGKKWLKPVCYNAILSCLYHELFEQLEFRNERFHRLERGPRKDRSIFMIGLVGIFAHDVPKVLPDGKLSKTLIDVKDRNRMAEEMWWGFRHYVTPSELLLFNHRHPLHSARPKPQKDFILPQYYNSIIDRRYNDEGFGGYIDHERGRYPEEIEKMEKIINDRLDKRMQKRMQKSSQWAALPDDDDDDW
jgi:hypothetical protein